MRYAIYLAPSPDEDLWTFGSGVIGYDAVTGDVVSHPRPSMDQTDWSSWTAEPRKYGFHGTLKAPFRLAEGKTLGDIDSVASELASAVPPFRVPRLIVRLIGSFAALVPAAACPELDLLAAACVRAFEPLRAPLNEAERAKRLRTPLSPRQLELLERYGYPYVLDQFRFHMTLTGRLPPDRAEVVRGRLAELYASVLPGLSVDALCIFEQKAPDVPFRVLRRVPMLG